MHSASRLPCAIVLCCLLASAPPSAGDRAAVHRQRYCMGTMFGIIVYHTSPADAERAIEKAMEEIARLDGVLSHYKDDSDLSKLNRQAGHGFVRVEPSLYEVVQQSMSFSRLSRGRFDVTIAPLLQEWKKAHAEGRRLSAAEIARVRGCVGYEKVETSPPDRIRYRSGCVAIELGGIGKGYAVDRALAVLRSMGMSNALVNAGGSSIGSIGAPPGRKGWPVHLGPETGRGRTVLLRDNSISTSQQGLLSFTLAAGGFGEILDPRTGAPIESTMAVSVLARSATAADALSTTLLMLSVEEAAELLDEIPDVSAVWMSAGGEVHAAYREARVHLADGR